MHTFTEMDLLAGSRPRQPFFSRLFYVWKYFCILKQTGDSWWGMHERKVVGCEVWVLSKGMEKGVKVVILPTFPPNPMLGLEPRAFRIHATSPTVLHSQPFFCFVLFLFLILLVLHV